MRFSYPPLRVILQYVVAILRSLWVHRDNAGKSLHVNREKELLDELSGDNEALYRQMC